MLAGYQYLKAVHLVRGLDIVSADEKTVQTHNPVARMNGRRVTGADIRFTIRHCHRPLVLRPVTPVTCISPKTFSHEQDIIGVHLVLPVVVSIELDRRFVRW